MFDSTGGEIHSLFPVVVRSVTATFYNGALTFIKF